MWQVLVAAAIAGSGYIAKNLLTNHSTEAADSTVDEETSSIFRFSSPCNRSKNVRKKLGRNSGIKYNRVTKVGSEKVEDDHKKKFAVCLKKRRTGRNSSAKCNSFDVKGNLKLFIC